MQNNSRIERAWQSLEPWGRKWYRRSSGKPLFIMGGGSVDGLFYLPAVQLSSMVSFLEKRQSEFTHAEARRNNGSFDTPVGDLTQFAAACQRTDIQYCVCRVRFQVSLNDGPLEVTGMILRETETLANVTFTWNAVEAFFDAPDLRTRFLSIFHYFVSLQEELNAPDLYFGDTLSFRSERLDLAAKL